MVTAGYTQLAIVPVGETWLVKSIRVTKLAGDLSTFALFLGTPDADGLLQPPYAMPADKLAVQDSSWHVGEAGDEIGIDLTGDPVTVRVSGTRLPAGPS